ncbi:winged helix-turn-helix domain-containing protein [Aliikangiella coralliicola]|nr:winged helix-turn-helix domain-containing protein [Aliikangiella coralliicola]
MAQIRFLDFRFNTQTYHLYRGEVRCDIRPKTAQLLEFLLRNNDRTLTKKELFQAIWRSEHVQDHTLFQLIGELRKLSPDNELIRTQPNVGYRWVADTSVKKTLQLSTPIKWAACVSCISIFATIAAISIPAHQNNKLEKHFAMPAISAYSKAVVAFQQGEDKAAEEWLRFSLTENPDSRESRLLLAEILYRNNNLPEAETHLQTILSSEKSSAYETSAAANLLSRLYQKKGNVIDALQYAIDGVQNLDFVRAECTVEVFDERIQSLQQLIANQNKATQVPDKLQAQLNQINASQLEADLERQRTSIKARSEKENQSPKNLSIDCGQLKQTQKSDEESACTTDQAITRIAVNQVFRRSRQLS